MPLGKMTYDKKLDTFKSYVPFIEKILKKYDGQKGIIHTNSFELSSWIESHIKNERLVFHDASNKDEMLLKHMSTELPTVLVSPSVTTGVSFDHDKARFQIIAKIPYPSLASKKNKVRQKNNPQWYAFTTISKIIQSSFGILLNSSGVIKALPRIWSESLVPDFFLFLSLFTVILFLIIVFSPNAFEKNSTVL